MISADDYRPENLNLDRYNIIGSAVLASSHLRSFQPVSLSMQGFEAGALQDTAERQRQTHKSWRTGVPGDRSRLVEHADAKQRISAYIPEGYM